MSPVMRSRWRTFARWPELGENEIHIWKADLNRIRRRCGDLERTLPLSERKQARQHTNALDHDCHILACALRRSILSRYLRAKPHELKFTYNKNGKPQLSGGELRFNVSHSSGLMVCGVSRRFDVGVDVERIRAGVEEEIAGWFLSLRALRFLEKLPKPRRAQTFFRGWTRMEACGKALGLAFPENVHNFETLFENANAFPGSNASPIDHFSCQVQDFEPRKGYAAAIATRGGEGKITYCNWPTRCADDT